MIGILDFDCAFVFCLYSTGFEFTPRDRRGGVLLIPTLQPDRSRGQNLDLFYSGVLYFSYSRTIYSLTIKSSLCFDTCLFTNQPVSKMLGSSCDQGCHLILCVRFVMKPPLQPWILPILLWNMPCRGHLLAPQEAIFS